MKTIIQTGQVQKEVRDLPIFIAKIVAVSLTVLYFGIYAFETLTNN